MADLMFKIARYFAYGYFTIALYRFVLANDLTESLGHCFIGLLLILIAENIKYLIWLLLKDWKNWEE